MRTGTFGVGVGEVGRFNRSLPPKSQAEYDAAYELAFEVKRWFHYRHRLELSVPPYIDHTNVTEVLTSGYCQLLHKYRKYWKTLEPIVNEHIREFKEMYKDVLAEMQFTR